MRENAVPEKRRGIFAVKIRRGIQRGVLTYALKWRIRIKGVSLCQNPSSHFRL